MGPIVTLCLPALALVHILVKRVPGTWYLVPGTWNLEPGTWNQEPGTRNCNPFSALHFNETSCRSHAVCGTRCLRTGPLLRRDHTGIRAVGSTAHRLGRPRSIRRHAHHGTN